jgi:two-component system, sensor histidine kinase PdtaS
MMYDNEIRLKELRHRTTNFLHMLNSMIRIKMDRFESDEAHYACSQILSVVEAYNQIFQLLSANDTSDHRTIDSQQLFQKLTHILQAFPISQERQISIESNIENVPLESQYAVPLALIAIESFTNTMKYAFPPEHTGQCVFSIHFGSHEDRPALTLRDNGVGSSHVQTHSHRKFNPETETQPSGSGISIMKSLALQIDGHLETDFSNGNGTMVRLYLSPDLI